MNSLLATGRQHPENLVNVHSCFYCKKGFSDHQALGGHLRVHQEGNKSGITGNYPGCASNPIDLTGSNANPVINGQPESSSGGAWKILPPSDGETSPLGFSKKLCSHETGVVNAIKPYGNNLGNGKFQSIMSPYLSSPSGSAEIYHSNYLSSTAFAPLNVIGIISSDTFAPPTATGFPSDPSFCLGKNELCQFNTDEFRTWRDGTPLSCGVALQDLEYHDHHKLPNPAFAMSDPHLVYSSNHLPGFKESTIGSFPQRPSPISVQGEVSLSNKINALTCEGNKRPYLGDVPRDFKMMNASKRPKITSCLPVQTEKPQNKELLLFKDEEISSSGMGISFDAEEKGEEDLDLALHL